MLSILLAVSLGCAVKGSYVGLVDAPEDVEATGPVRLRAYDGRAWRLGLDEASAPLRWADAVRVEVLGPRVGRRILVQDWRVLDSGDGSGGFVGLLRPYGSRLVIDDRNTSSTLLIDDRSAERLRALEGRTVLLLGHVTGGNIVTVRAYRLLEAPAASP